MPRFHECQRRQIEDRATSDSTSKPRQETSLRSRLRLVLHTLRRDIARPDPRRFPQVCCEANRGLVPTFLPSRTERVSRKTPRKQIDPDWRVESANPGQACRGPPRFHRYVRIPVRTASAKDHPFGPELHPLRSNLLDRHESNDAILGANQRFAHTLAWIEIDRRTCIRPRQLPSSFASLQAALRIVQRELLRLARSYHDARRRREVADRLQSRRSRMIPIPLSNTEVSCFRSLSTRRNCSVALEFAKVPAISRKEQPTFLQCLDASIRRRRSVCPRAERPSMPLSVLLPETHHLLASNDIPSAFIAS